MRYSCGAEINDATADQFKCSMLSEYLNGQTMSRDGIPFLMKYVVDIGGSAYEHNSFGHHYKRKSMNQKFLKELVFS